MMTFRKFSIVLAIVCMFASSATDIFAGPKTFNWRFQGILPKGDDQHEQWVHFAEKVRQKSNGRLNIQVFAAGEVVASPGIYNSVKTGMLQGGLIVGLYAPEVPMGRIDVSLPFAFQFQNSKKPWIDARKMLKETGIWQMLEQAYAERGIHFYGFSYSTGYPAIYTNKPIKTLKDFKGLVIRQSGPIAKILKHFGASPTNVPISDVYMAMKLNTIDATSYDGTGMFGLKWHEVAKYYTLPMLTAPTFVTLIVNQDAWDSLPADLQQIFMESHENDNYLPIAKRMVELDQEILDKQEKYGYKVNYLPDEDMKKMSKYAVEHIWPELGKKSPRSAKVIEKLKAYYGYQ
ncbi:MAG: TRAP transporter substrate-binding protein DctP [Deltaproteobacteria bacterium]|nr:TRAP transporter substrate-binding protein DctP [Deltaproteobacteria bacterium]